MALLWTIALLLGAGCLSIPHWQPDSFSWIAWSDTFSWPLVCAVVIALLFGDWSWKRRLFETHAEKMKHAEYRDKYLKHALRNTPWLLPDNKPWHEMQKEQECSEK